MRKCLKLTDLAKLKKLLVSPETTQDVPKRANIDVRESFIKTIIEDSPYKT